MESKRKRGTRELSRWLLAMSGTSGPTKNNPLLTAGEAKYVINLKVILASDTHLSAGRRESRN